MKKYVKVTSLIVTAFLTVSLSCGCASSDYKKANELFKQGKYSQASEIYKKLNGYEDSANKAKQSDYALAGQKLKEKAYTEALAIFEQLGDYEDSKEQALECKYQQADAKLEADDCDGAVAIYEELKNYKDSKDKLKDAQHKIMVKKYSDVVEKLTGKKYFYSDGAYGVKSVKFKKDGIVYYEHMTVTDNGWSNDGNTGDKKYSIDDNNITLPDGTKVKYKKTGNDIVLPEKYLTEKQIKKEINGYWTYSYSDYVLGMSCCGENNYYFEDGTIQYEKASISYTGDSYYYYGPYYGTYSIGTGCLNVKQSGSSGTNIEIGFLIESNGEVSVYHFRHKCERGDGLPGENGYYHLLY